MGKYKYVSQTGTVAAVTDAFSDLQGLGEECREIVDNAGDGGLSQTQRIQTFSDTADNLENLTEPDVPDCVSDLAISYSTAEPKSKRQSTSRAVRRDNACAILRAACDALDTFADECRTKADELDEAEQDGEKPEAKEGEVEGPTADELREQADEADTLKDELEQAADEAEGCEFPGMFG